MTQYINKIPARDKSFNPHAIRWFMIYPQFICFVYVTCFFSVRVVELLSKIAETILLFCYIFFFRRVPWAGMATWNAKMHLWHHCLVDALLMGKAQVLIIEHWWKIWIWRFDKPAAFQKIVVRILFSTNSC